MPRFIIIFNIILFLSMFSHSSKPSNYYKDWQCPQCEFNNFALNDKCKKCSCFRSKALNYNNQVKKKGDWVCECTELNFASRTSCRKCLKPINNDTNETPSSQTISFKTGDWYCACGEINFKNRINCYKCKKIKEVTQSSNDDKLQDTVNTTVNNKTEDWQCTSCGEHNFDTRNCCRRCAKEK